jgi:hypothetical protein
MVYIAETREKVRERIGRLMYGAKFLKDVVASVGANYIAANKAARFRADHFSGHVLYVVDGLAVGTSTYISESESATAQLTLSPVPLVMPAPGDKIEVWPEETTPDDVNEAINLAILEVQHLTATPAVATSPTIDSARTRITIPATWSMISRLTYEYGGLKYRLRPRDPRDPRPEDQAWPLTFDIEAPNAQIHVYGGVPSSASNVRLVGYAMPSLPTSDADLLDLRSDYVVYKAASILAQSRMGSPEIDPQGHGGKATFWTGEADKKKREMVGQAMANTARIEEVL